MNSSSHIAVNPRNKLPSKVKEAPFPILLYLERLKHKNSSALSCLDVVVNVQTR